MGERIVKKLLKFGTSRGLVVPARWLNSAEFISLEIEPDTITIRREKIADIAIAPRSE
jgi:hypothetical protein